MILEELPKHWLTYWKLRTGANPYTVRQALQYMRDEEALYEWHLLTPEKVRQFELKYQRRHHPTAR